MAVLKVSLLLFMIAYTFALSKVQDPPGPVSIPIFKGSHSLARRGICGPDDNNIVQARVARTKSKLAHGFAAYERNTGTVHPLLTDVQGTLTASGETLPVANLPQVTKRANAVDPAIVEEFSILEFWYSGLIFSTTQQAISVELDLASGDTFVPSSECDATCIGDGAVWFPKFSSTAVNTTIPFTTFALDGCDGTASGFIFTDNFRLGPEATASDQAIGAAIHYSTELKSDSPAFPITGGRIGLGTKAISHFGDHGMSPFFTTLVAQTSVEPIFALAMSKNNSGLTLGGVNLNAFTGGFRNVSIIGNGFYQLSLKGLFVNNEEVLSVGKDTEMAAILDSATTFIQGPFRSVQLLYSTIPGAKDASAVLGPGVFTVPCDNVPVIGLKLDKDVFNIDPAIFSQVILADGDCVGGIVGAETPFWVLGTVFLQNFYTVIDQKHWRVSFATLSDGPCSECI